MKEAHGDMERLKRLTNNFQLFGNLKVKLIKLEDNDNKRELKLSNFEKLENYYNELDDNLQNCIRHIKQSDKKLAEFQNSELHKKLN